MLQHDSHYAGAHYARALAAEHEGDEKTAREEFDTVKQLWKNADPDLPELKRRSR
jgi:Tfp pilus assembly protein PilF